MKEKQSKEIKDEVMKKATHGKATANAGKELETYEANSFTPAGDRVTPYEAEEDLAEKANPQE